VYFITDACESGASKVRGASHTVFAGILLDILCGQTTDSPDQLTLGEICRQLRRIMLERGFPVPQQRGTATADLLVLSRATPIGTGPLRPDLLEKIHAAEAAPPPGGDTAGPAANRELMTRLNHSASTR
jgi:hypothetical protein